jgi:phosphate:Na+ symporter
VGAYHHVITDIERIGDYSENFIQQKDKMKAQGIEFSDTAIAEITQMYNKVNSMFDLTLHVFDNRDFDSLEKVAQIEDEVDDMKDEFGASHIARLHSGNCDVERGTYYFSVISALERIGDHLINVAFSIKNPTGSQSKRVEINDMPKA